MLILNEREFTDEEINALDISHYVDSLGHDIITRRKVLYGISAASAGIIMPAIIGYSETAEAAITDLVKAFIQGGIDFVNELIRWGERVVTVLKFVNDQVVAVEGIVASTINKVEEGVRDTGSQVLQLPPKKVLTVQDDQFTANKDYGEGNFSYVATTGINSSQGGFKVIDSQPV